MASWIVLSGTAYVQITRLAEQAVLLKKCTRRRKEVRVVRGAVEPPKPPHTRDWEMFSQVVAAAPVRCVRFHVDSRIYILGLPLSYTDTRFRAVVALGPKGSL